jgi:hypothetical protein
VRQTVFQKRDMAYGVLSHVPSRKAIYSSSLCKIITNCFRYR